MLGLVTCAAIVMVYAGSNASGAATTPQFPQLSNLTASSHDDAALITWHATGTDAYQVDIDDNANFSSPQQLNATGTTAVADGLKPDTTYYVRVSSPNTTQVQPVNTSFTTAPSNN